ncbi:MAG: cytochrome d ubiquinol oxidase subunit II [Deltaproteobacteria bacterium]|nr:MAG: cytochrome d ubiquinol oxidase subunit II [Deltaproteobacteria bacterium]
MELQAIWFYIWGLLWAVFFMTGGFDLGIGALYPVLGKSDTEKRMMITALGPLWDGNEVWLITAGGVTFAAFPILYAAMFSTLYTPLMLILFALIIRGVSFEFRDQIDNPNWRMLWDGCIFIGSTLPAILFGVAFANIFAGNPLDGGLFSLITPYTLLGGILFQVMFLVHGALWLCIKTEGDLQDRTVKATRRLWPAELLVAALFLVASWFATPLYDNYLKNPMLFLVIIVTVGLLVAVRMFLAKGAYFKAWFASAGTIAGATFFGVIGLFPTLFPPTYQNDLALTAYNAASSPLTLKIMLVVVLIFIPMVIAYQTWAYNLFKTKVTPEDMDHGEAY